ncbi:hypothetical protein FC70_GL001500 [Paucilactobacillus oligofermentans DSM 15707 = LMG 22743]|uniref:UPF0154 protein FC70_GL001500 n=1 Tax=Paucilactobacillus oligofermentans DSM 15707 = LMG 22743 TaxID=1423778 RepID=A0A0R1RC46_9LACO|nr:YneF family protein [Paucilactobacillus oligofermentans]KRL54701.1 hypothetical protein FC70_GL001500 [Paucilactobacillus oligofermentans DSM 15707 = LMG 22743]CUS26388.1 UPF0154 protein YneF [Paucilactobacillus oligofermentans DSM 15707 = LMG 22743]
MSTGIWILLIVVALVIGLVGGFFGARKYMETYLKNNPPINEEMLSTMMLQMGQKPSAKKLHQMMQAMQQQSKNSK